MRVVGSLTVAAPGDRDIVMTRVFNAPRRLVFDALTKPELLRRWFSGPPGWILAECQLDLRVGGEYRYLWRGSDGVEMGMRGVFREVVPPERIVQTEVFDHSMSAGEAVGTLVLAERDGRTLLTLTVVYASPEARDAVLKTPMEQGVAAGYDKLAELLIALAE